MQDKDFDDAVNEYKQEAIEDENRKRISPNLVSNDCNVIQRSLELEKQQRAPAAAELSSATTVAEQRESRLYLYFDSFKHSVNPESKETR
jgi:hypothetical protein